MIEKLFVEGEKKIDKCGTIVATNKRLIKAVKTKKSFFASGEYFIDMGYSELVNITYQEEKNFTMLFIGAILTLLGTIINIFNSLGIILLLIGVFIVIYGLIKNKETILSFSGTNGIIIKTNKPDKNPTEFIKSVRTEYFKQKDTKQIDLVKTLK